MRTRYCLTVIACLLCALSATAAEFLGKIAFLRDGNLWVQDVPSGTARQVTTSGKAVNPAWSATGRWLSYNEGDSTYVVDVANPETPRRISTEFLKTAWSPTADVLAGARATGGLFLIEAGRWQEKYLVRESTVESFAWSPDGTQLAYVRFSRSGTNLVAELYRIAATGAGSRRLLRVTGGRYLPIITGWTPDGKYITFLQDLAYSASLLADGVPLAAVPAAGGQVRVFTKNTPVLGGLAFSPDGRRMAVLQRPGRESWQNAQLFISPVSTVRLRALTAKSEAPLFPAWSPQGSLLAYSTGPAGPSSLPLTEAARLFAQRHVVLVDPETGARKGDTRTDDNRDEYPLWTADGRHLLFTRITPEGQAGVWAMSAQANAQQPVVERISPGDQETGWAGFYGTVNWPAVLGWWPGQRLAQPGLLFDWRTYAPLRATVEALGGTVDWQASTRTAMITLNGKTLARTQGGEMQDDLAIRDGVLYAQVILLVDQFRLGLHWNAPAREAVLVNSPGARIVIISTRVVSSVRAPVRGVFPLAFAGPQYSYLIGGVARRRYLDDDFATRFLRGGERYTLYTLTERLGSARGSRPREDYDESGYGQYLTFSPKPQKEAYAVHASWDALPRRPVRDRPGATANRRMMREVLDSRGLANVAPKVDQAVLCDLDGDGETERLVSASADYVRYFEDPAPGDYSFVAIRDNGRTRVICGEFFAKDISGYLPPRYRLAGLLDVDGDRRQEVIVHYDWYEGAGEVVYRVGEHTITELYHCYAGL